MMALPLTSSLAFGVAVPIPTFPLPLTNIMLLSDGESILNKAALEPEM